MCWYGGVVKIARYHAQGIIFFFSSRRRHTSLRGDWSSDVCSSDLEILLSCHIQGGFLWNFVFAMSHMMAHFHEHLALEFWHLVTWKACRFQISKSICCQSNPWLWTFKWSASEQANLNTVTWMGAPTKLSARRLVTVQQVVCNSLDILLAIFAGMFSKDMFTHCTYGNSWHKRHD